MFRKAVILLTGTAAAVTSVLSYHPPQLTPVVTKSEPIAESPKSSIPQQPAPTSGDSSKSKPTSQITPASPTQNLGISGVFTGNLIQTRWGPVQVEITLKNNNIIAASALKFPNGDQRSLSISQQAIPYLVEQTLGVVNASQVQGVSRATYTSEAWRTSLGSAIKKAGI